MKIVAPLLVLSCLLLGCQTKRLGTVEAEYDAVHPGETRAELIEHFGRPDQDNHHGDLAWRYGRGAGDYESYVQLDVHLDGQDRVVTRRVRRGQNHFPTTHEAGALSPQVMPSER